MKKDETPTKDSMPTITISLEKNLTELAEEFRLRIVEGEEMIEDYSKGNVEFEKLLDQIKELQRISRAIQGGMTLQIQRYYGRSKNARTLRTFKELGYDAPDRT